VAEQLHRTVDANGISVHLVEQGEGPLVLFCHGFPESWYSWRHQLPAVAAAGYRAVAMDMRGYGGSSKPAAVGAYSLNHLVGDVVGVVHALGEREAVVVGHDWGAPVAWFSALLRPDVFRAVCAMSVPFTGVIPALPDGVTIGDLMRVNAGPERDYYRLFFQEPGVAEADLEADVRRSALGFLYLISGDIVADGVAEACSDGHFPAGQTLSEQFVLPDRLPPWLTEADVAFYTAELTASGFRGGLNWYRNIDALPGILAPFQGRTIMQPSCYVGGTLDLIAGNTPEAIAGMRTALPDLRVCRMIEGAGHWIQQERAPEVTEVLLGFLASLDSA
jgi:pimeloyl-ACP methyl ester carboxylesterase